MISSNTCHVCIVRLPRECSCCSSLKKFRELRGFHEQVLFAEDYLLSQQVERKRFGIVRGGVYTTNRRFQKMGHLRVGWLFLKTAMNYWNENYFLRDHKYWQT